MKNRISFAVLLLAVVTIVYVADALRQYRPYTFSYADPGWMVWTVVSLAEDHDLDLKNQLHGDPNSTEEQIAIGARGEWYPVHEPLMPVLTVPFYLALSYNGCLAFNILISCLLTLTFYALALRHTSAGYAFIAATLMAFTGATRYYVYSYSVDVFGCLLVLVSFLQLTRARPLASGFFYGLAVLGRLSSVFLLPGLLVYIALNSGANGSRGSLKERGKALSYFLLGGLPLGLIFLWQNYAMFGNALDIAYAHQYIAQGAEHVVRSQYSKLDRSLVEGFMTNLFDRTNGFFPGSPLVVIALIFGLKEYFRRARSEAIACSVIAMTLVGFFCNYEVAYPGVGNRYFLPIVGLSVIPLAIALEKIFQKNGEGIETK